MSLLFYLIQLINPGAYNSMPLQPPIDTYEVFYAKQATLQAEKVCLARIVFNEASGEPVLGKKLVAQTALNRVASGKFQSGTCSSMKTRGAYSFYNSKSKKSVDKVRKYPVEYTKIAEEALAGKYEKLISKKVLYFKVCSHYNSFFETLVMVRKVNNHCFFRENEAQLTRR